MGILWENLDVAGFQNNVFLSFCKRIPRGCAGVGVGVSQARGLGTRTIPREVLFELHIILRTREFQVNAMQFLLVEVKRVDHMQFLTFHVNTQMSEFLNSPMALRSWP